MHVTIDDTPRPEGEELSRRLAEVQACARRIARGDRALGKRGDMDAQDVAQDIAEQYLERRTEPISLMGWAATATRCRLIDLANKRRPLTIEHDELFRVMAHRMGPSAAFVAREQYRGVVAALGAVEQAVINEHLTGATDEQIARAHDYVTAGVAAATISRIKNKLRGLFPAMLFDLAPQRVYD